MKYPVDQIMKLKEALAHLPKVAIADKENVTATEAVSLLSDVLLALKEKGYTLAMVGKLLNDNGLEISLSTLRRHLRRPASHGSKRPKKTRTGRGAVAIGQLVLAPDQSPERLGAASDLHDERAAAQPQSGMKSSSFAVREDSDDI